MFAAANSIAQKFTLPIVISFRRFNGKCSAEIGSFVIINEEGWVVTAAHIIHHIVQLRNEKDKYLNLLKQREQVESDPGKKPHEKKGLLKTLTIPPESITEVSSWMVDTHIVKNWKMLKNIDIAVGKLENFDKTRYSTYPQFKDPSKPMLPGSSLCKLGFPFHHMEPTFDTQSSSFTLPAGSLPIPFFPVEGIFTRTVNVKTPDPAPFPLSYIETSSPGLKGQSGGPTFDIHGTVWAIQSSTQHLKLGFGAGPATGSLTTKELDYLKNQYLHVAWGVHSETLINFFKQEGISFQLSPY